MRVTAARCARTLTATALIMILSGRALAHLGAQNRDKATHLHRLVKAYEAEEVVAQKDRVRADALASGGRSVRAAPGTTFRVKTPPLRRGMYAFYVTGRMEKEFFPEEGDGPDVFFRFTVDAGRGGAPETYSRIHAIFNDRWQYVQELYFHADAAQRAYQAVIEVEPDSPGELVLDRIELRDALAGVEVGAYKRARNLYTEDEVKRIALRGLADRRRSRRPARTGPLPLEARQARDRELAAQIPRINALSREEFGGEFRRLRNLFEERLGGVHRKSDAEIYLLTGDPVRARDTAFLLALAAYNWPAYNYRLRHIHHGPYNKVKRIGEFKRQWGKLHIYRGWAGPMVRGMIRSYDILFPFIEGNRELASALSRYIPWVQTPQDVIALMDSYLVQLSWRDYQRHQGASPVELVAAVLGPCDLSERLLNQYSRFREEVINQQSRDGLTYIGSTYYAAAHSDAPFRKADLLARYVAAGGEAKWNIADPERFPRLATLFDSLLGLSVAGGMRNNTGDLGDPGQRGRRIYQSTVKDPDRFFYRGWQWTRDPRYAWVMVNAVGIPEAAKPGERRAIEADARKTGDPLLRQRSRVQGGFGIAVLESGQEVPDPRFKRTVVVRTGIASGHAQSDSLNLALYAFGCRMAPDLGGRSRGAYGRPSTHLTRLHNVVEVDKRPIGGKAINATGYAWVDYFKPFEGAQVLAASAQAESHPHVDLYRRTTALIDISAGRPAPGKAAVLPSLYVFDVFRVRGGTTHTYCFHGAVSDAFQVNADLKTDVSETGAAYLRRHRPGTFREGVSADPLEASWRLRRRVEVIRAGQEKEIPLKNVERDFLGALYDPASPPKFTRLTLFGHGGERVLSGEAWCYQARKYSWPMLYVQRRSDRPLASVYPAIVEASVGESAIASKRRLPVTPAEPGAEGAVAVEVRTKPRPEEPAHVDRLFASEKPDRVYRVGDGAEVAARFAYVSTDADGLRMLHLIGGTRLKTGAVEVTLETGAHRARIVGADYRRREIVLDAALPARLLVGERMRVGNARHRADYEIAAARRDGPRTVVRWRKSAATYLGVLREVFAEAGYVVPETPPSLFDYHPKYYDGMTAVAESGATWKVDVERGDRWMYLGFPVAEQHRNRLSWRDIPDADGDGRRTLRMYASGRATCREILPDGSLRTLAPGRHMLDLEVTRVSADGLQFWFKQHPMRFADSLGVAHRGWPYHDMLLKNEDGSRTWVSMLPEDDIRIHLKGGPVTAEALADRDGDGKRRLAFYHFGVGDAFEVPAHLFLRRLPRGGFEVRANVEGKVIFRSRGRTRRMVFDRAALSQTGGRLTVE